MGLPIENKRLKELINLKNYGSVNAFAQDLGLTAAHINRFFIKDSRNHKYPSILKSPSVLKAIQEKFPEITMEWFNKNEDSDLYDKENVDFLKELLDSNKKEKEINEKIEQMSSLIGKMYVKILELEKKVENNSRVNGH